MSKELTLKELFESHKDELANQLSIFSLPNDASRIQNTVSDYLNLMLENEGEYRQHLTQSEDYILQVALSLLNAQQEMGKKLSEMVVLVHQTYNEEPKQDKEQKIAQNPIEKFLNQQVDGKKTLIGAGGGALLGKVVVSTGWGAVWGAIAGTALVIYYSSLYPKNNCNPFKTSQQTSIAAPSVAREQKINVEVFINIVGNICDSVDSLIQTFRAQINRVVDKYESIEKPQLEKEYRFLIEGIQTLIGYKRTHANDEKYLTKLQMRIEDVAELFENYNLTVEDYSEEHKSWFDTVESSKVTAPQMVYPAIVRDEKAVLMGKVFVPQI